MVWFFFQAPQFIFQDLLKNKPKKKLYVVCFKLRKLLNFFFISFFFQFICLISLLMQEKCV